MLAKILSSTAVAMLLISFAISDEFDTDGPYGILYFDTAAL